VGTPALAVSEEGNERGQPAGALDDVLNSSAQGLDWPISNVKTWALLFPELLDLEDKDGQQVHDDIHLDISYKHSLEDIYS
jgi:hypothetical protein